MKIQIFRDLIKSYNIPKEELSTLFEELIEYEDSNFSMNLGKLLFHLFKEAERKKIERDHYFIDVDLQKDFKDIVLDHDIIYSYIEKKEDISFEIFSMNLLNMLYYYSANRGFELERALNSFILSLLKGINNVT